jgi:hypothetical protein
MRAGQELFCMLYPDSAGIRKNRLPSAVEAILLHA